MKKGVILTSLFLLTSLLALAHGKEKELKLDPKVKHGKLANGLTYYIRANAMPENRAEFYIVNNVGAILETDAQDGLAHFCEHMAFNGTKNFPGKGVLNFLETNGV
ncbi:MAG: insulinase family protein, partial [Bacteroidota bacterium]